MNPEYATKLQKFKAMEQSNAKAAISKVRPRIEALGFKRSTRSRGRFELQIASHLCVLGVSKLSLSPRIRVTGRIDSNHNAGFLESDEFTCKGHPSGLKFALDVSRFTDNSDTCAEQIVSFIELVALPWFNKAVAQQGIQLDGPAFGGSAS
ncbi:MAG: hypothetical protein E6R07_15005 [Nevskiaceae bacterium]|nr:MAG: hypothetical protein E6R07_15005 [Nevskiaceae bacterium]